MQRLITGKSTENESMQVTRPKWDINITLPSRIQRISWKNGQKEFKSQKERMNYTKHCLLDMTCHPDTHELIRPAQDQFSQNSTMKRKDGHEARPLSEWAINVTVEGEIILAWQWGDVTTDRLSILQYIALHPHTYGKHYLYNKNERRHEVGREILWLEGPRWAEVRMVVVVGRYNQNILYTCKK